MVYFTNTSAGIIQASIYVTQLPVELPKSMANATPTSMQILVSVLFQSEQPQQHVERSGCAWRSSAPMLCCRQSSV